MKVFQNKAIYNISYIGYTIDDTREIFRRSENIWRNTREHKILALEEGEDLTVVSKELRNKNKINGNETLYFYKTSKFPRFKLKDTGFKRCIKPEKATAFVTDSLLDYVGVAKDALIYESDSIYFVVYKDFYSLNAYAQSIGCTIEQLFAANMHMFKTNVGDVEVKLVFSGKIKFDIQADIICDAWNNKRTLIFDKDLDNYVSENSLNEMTKEDFVQIRDLLESSDKQSNGLGLRLLSGMNIDPFIGSLSWLFSNNLDQIKSCNEWSTNSVKLVKDKLKLIYHQNLESLRMFFNIARSEDDKLILNEISFSVIKEYISSRINVDYINDDIKEFGRKVTISIE